MSEKMPSEASPVENKENKEVSPADRFCLIQHRIVDESARKQGSEWQAVAPVVAIRPRIDKAFDILEEWINSGLVLRAQEYQRPLMNAIHELQQSVLRGAKNVGLEGGVNLLKVQIDQIISNDETMKEGAIAHEAYRQAIDKAMKAGMSEEEAEAAYDKAMKEGS